MSEVLTCVNCGYEVSELTSESLCQTCWKAYDLGFQEGERARAGATITERIGA